MQLSEFPRVQDINFCKVTRWNSLWVLVTAETKQSRSSWRNWKCIDYAQPNNVVLLGICCLPSWCLWPRSSQLEEWRNTYCYSRKGQNFKPISSTFIIVRKTKNNKSFWTRKVRGHSIWLILTCQNSISWCIVNSISWSILAMQFLNSAVGRNGGCLRFVGQKGVYYVETYWLLWQCNYECS